MSSRSPNEPYQRVLAIETATQVQALSLIDGSRCLEHRISRVRYNHGSSLLRNVDLLLTEQGVDVEAVDLFAVGLGPGSFTGLRVGLATAKALSLATKKPIVGVSSLAALAFQPAQANPGATVIAVLDARRNEVYAGAFRWSLKEGLIEVMSEHAIAPQELIERMEAEPAGPLVIVGDGVGVYTSLRTWASTEGVVHLPEALAMPSALAIGLLGRLRALTEGPADRASLEPNYLRPSDAKLPDIAPHPDYPRDV
jgi:tRNA threonylcarbamoyladenosine biosynthesis protein TsaB